MDYDVADFQLIEGHFGNERDRPRKNRRLHARPGHDGEGRAFLGHDHDHPVPPDDHEDGDKVGQYPEIPPLGFLGQTQSRKRTLAARSKTCPGSVSKF